jgi:hypothetical protein
MSPRDKLGQLRSLCGEKGFAMEPLPGARMFRLIWIDVGHAVRNGGRGTAAFNLEEAIRFLQRFEAEA